MQYIIAIGLIIMCLNLSVSASEQEVEFESLYNCARMPSFIRTKGLSPQVAIDTTVAKLPGLVIRELTGRRRLYQGDSWPQTGHIGSTVRDSVGNIYVIPVPSVALDTNPLATRNRVYKVDSITGEMELLIGLPLPSESTQTNPFGTVGMALDCETNSLYVSSVAGSTPSRQKGKIYQINLKTKQVIDIFDMGVDSLGLGLVRQGRFRRLYFGDARSSSVYSIALSKQGGFNHGDKPRHEVSLLGIKNGDSTQVRKIRFTKVKNRMQMILDETEFSYRMAADTSRVYKTYTFEWDSTLNKWLFDSMLFK